MRFPTEKELEKIRKKYPAGCKVRLVSMQDPQAPEPGTIGEVLGCDDAGDLLMRWSNGSGLKVILGEDVIEKVKGRA